MVLRYFTLEEILRIHFQLIEDYGGHHGIRDRGRLMAAVDAPRLTLFGEEQHKTVFQKAALYIRNIIADHPFVDGNKRAAITIGVLFVLRNGYNLTADNQQLADFAVRVAVKKLSVQQIADWLQQHSVKP